jgi:preprotein translocase subunit SecA
MSEDPLRPWVGRHVFYEPYPQRREPRINQWDTALFGMARALTPPPVRSANSLKQGVSRVEALASKYSALNDRDMLTAAGRYRIELVRHGLREDLVAEVFGLVREASTRHIGLRHFPVQLMGGLALLRGQLVEMQTGEGKTITALLPAVTAALCGIPVHVVTVNDYLAQRDFEWLKPVYEALGVTVGIVQHGQDPTTRRKAYGCDVTYCTNKELAFDYLRDTIALRAAGRQKSFGDWAHSEDGSTPLLLRGLCYAIVDEADSVLIDEARTPLIISSQGDSGEEADRYRTALELAGILVATEDFIIREKERAARLTPKGAEKLAKFASNLDGLWRSRRAREELLEQALSAIHLYQRDKHYIVTEDKVQIVDEFTGRVLADRSWERGLQQIIEVKELREITAPRHTLAQITYQRFFRRFLWLSGMTGTATEVAKECKAVYNLGVTKVPTNRPILRKDLGVRVFRTDEQKWDSVVASATQAKLAGRPVLIGTRSVAASEFLSQRFDKLGLDHTVLNARVDGSEAAIIADAGSRGKITIATNMAGRGTDIRLAEGVKEVGGLHVILTEFHESPRIDRQLFGRAGRQGDPGTFEALVSVEDELFQRFTKWIVSASTQNSFGDLTVIPPLNTWILRRSAQRSAERFNYRARQETIRRSEHIDRSLAFAGNSE